MSNPTTLPYRTVGEWSLTTAHPYANPFLDVRVLATFTTPSDKAITIPGFYDGDGTWRVRFNPNEVGTWQFQIRATPANPDLELSATLTVTPNNTRGFLKATPGQAWGFQYESGEPVFVFGDTTYNLFGAAHCGLDVPSFLERRANQGFNLLRVRLQVSPFHGPEGYSQWQTRRTWPWGGSEQSPQLDRFNLEWFQTVDDVVRLTEKLGIGLEMIMQAWASEFPFHNRNIFTAEWEQHWVQYLIARYDAYNCTYIWTLMNEYEHYPTGNVCRHSTVADQWALRMARWVKSIAAHGHIIAIHNGPQMPPFAQRFATDPDAIDAVMYQEWGAIEEDYAWLTPNIENKIRDSFVGWPGSYVLSEYGYERDPELPETFPLFEYLGPEHNRRGAWRAVFSATGVITGFEYTWGPHQILDRDQVGMPYLLHVRRFVSEIIEFHQYHPAPELLVEQEYSYGFRPLVLATEANDKIAVYFPAGGSATLKIKTVNTAHWYDPRTGRMQSATPASTDAGIIFKAPAVGNDPTRPWDWVLVAE